MLQPGDYKQGLTTEQVVQSRIEHGDNTLTPPPKESGWKLFFEKFKDPIIRILLITLALSVAVSLYQYFTGVADARVLLEPLGIFIAVLRNGLITQIERKDVVVGDMVFINPGDEIPADGTLLEAIALQVNESSLTGEPIANKTVNEEEFESEATYPSN